MCRQFDSVPAHHKNPIIKGFFIAEPCANRRRRRIVTVPAAGFQRTSRRLNAASERATGVSALDRCSHNTGRAYSFSSSALAAFESAVPKPSVNQLLDLREHRARLVAAAGAVESRARLIVARSFAFRLHL